MKIHSLHSINLHEQYLKFFYSISVLLFIGLFAFDAFGGDIQKVVDTNIKTWIFVAHDQSPQRWVDMTKKCVLSCLKRTTLKPVCIFYGSNQAPLISWLEDHNVEIIFHSPKWASHIENVVDSAAGRYNTRFSPLYESTVSLVSTFLRLDLPILLNPTEHGPLVLYTDTDVIFRRTPAFSDFAKDLKVPDYFIMGTEGSKKYHQKHNGNINAGIMLINLPNMRKTYYNFVSWVFGRKNLNRGLHFGKFGPGDQGAYNEYYVSQFPIVESPAFNWKPYWGWNADACIVHFHGPKPSDYRKEFYGGSGISNPNFKVLFELCKTQSVSTENDCLRWVEEYDSITLN